ncbi:MAG: thioredoxin [Breznakibacter sp.]
MKHLLLPGVLALFFATSTSCANSTASNPPSENNQNDPSKVIYLTKETFKTEVFNYETQKEWKYTGKVPAILDFYADWCGPCRMVSPLLEELQKEYDGKIQVFKVNTDNERELAATFGIQSLPTIVFIPMEGQPQAILGFRPKEDLQKMVTDVLKVQR